MRTDETPAVQFYRGILNASSIKLDNTQKQKLDPSYDCEKLMAQLTEMELDRAELAHSIVELRSRNGELGAELAETEKIQCDEKRTEKLKSQLTEIELDRTGLAHTVVELRSRIENLEGELAESQKIQSDEKLTSSKEIEKLERLLEDSEAKLSEQRSECRECWYEIQQHHDLLRRCEAKLRVILVRGDFAVVKDQIPIPSDQFLRDLADLNEDPRDPVLNYILEIDSLVRTGTKLMIDVRVPRFGTFMSIRDLS
jgi:chromosome segregation ATPase